MCVITKYFFLLYGANGSVLFVYVIYDSDILEYTQYAPSISIM